MGFVWAEPERAGLAGCNPQAAAAVYTAATPLCSHFFMSFKSFTGADFPPKRQV